MRNRSKSPDDVIQVADFCRSRSRGGKKEKGRAAIDPRKKEKRETEKLRSQRDRKKDAARERERTGKRYLEDPSWCPAKAIYW